MKSFKAFFGEDFELPIVSPSEDGKHEHGRSKNLHNPDIRAQLNVVLLRVTDGGYANPWTALNNAAKQLGFYGLQLPRVHFPAIDGGEVVWQINQYGQPVHGYAPVAGSENDTDEQLYFFFEYQLQEDGRYVCFAEITNHSTVDGYLSDSETVKEEIELDELSKSLLTRYSARATLGKKDRHKDNALAVKKIEKKANVKEETITETLENHHERLVTGVANGKGFQKTFESAEHQKKWASDQKDLKIHNVQRVHEEIEMSTEKLFELSTEKLMQYVAKSSRSKKDRSKGLDKASKKVVGEETTENLDELSNEKMLQYAAKAGRDKKDRSKGLDKVSKKVVGEEEKKYFYLSELSGGKLMQYVAKAARSKKDREKGIDKAGKKAVGE